MEERFWRAVAPVAVTNLPSATRSRIAGLPKKNRVLRSKDFRTVYDTGTRFANPLFAAFCLCQPNEAGPYIGFTVTKAIGNAVVRNRLRRRFREAVSLRLAQLTPPWSVVINPRRAAIECPFADLDREIGRLFTKCSKLDCVRP
jgi:ribonuclease P protein component